MNGITVFIKKNLRVYSNDFQPCEEKKNEKTDISEPGKLPSPVTESAETHFLYFPDK